MKRIFLFLITNIAVLLVLSTVTSLLGLNQVLTANGLDPWALLIFSAIFGFGGAIISLLISKPMAKWSTGAQVIKAPRNESETWLVDTVKKLADKAGVGMPEV
ncbi:MAG TPA: zinc metalloprotease HtpX, partial [Casimicrobiaceae bacterium]|nr:zinc metalloprotease HtpX [Casimicrobiaceae bacterium]